MGYDSLKNIISSIEDGKKTISVFRKSPIQITTAGNWIDLSMSPGLPSPNYYASNPLVSSTIEGKGLYTGGNVSPSDKYLLTMTLIGTSSTPLPLKMILCDYVIYYPFIDMSDTTEQILTNSVTIPRYTSQGGLQIMAVQVASQVGGSTFYVNYTNDAGTSNRQTPIITCNSQTAIGTLINTNSTGTGFGGPFLPLQNGDSGVQSIQSVVFTTPDVGLLTFVLVKPLASVYVRGIDAPSEFNFLRDKAGIPKIEDDSYLNLIADPNGSLSGTSLYGIIETIWS